MSNTGMAQNWRDEVAKDNVQREPSVMDTLDIIKVYNKSIGGEADIEKAGNIITKTPGEEWKVLGKDISLNVLLVRKFYTGFAPRLNELGDVQRNDKGDAIKDFYYTPEVDVFNKDNIALGVMKSGMPGRIVIGRDSKQNFEEYIKAPKIDGKVNPLFKEVKTNTTTMEKYATSWIRLGYVIYAQDENGKVYKILPGGSYGRFNDVKPGTFEDLKIKSSARYKELYDTYCDPSFIDTDIGVRFDEGYYYLDWKLKGFQDTDNRTKVEEVRQLINTFNKERFEGIEFDQPLQQIGYADPLKLEAPKVERPVIQGEGSPVVNEEITIEDIPF